MNIGIAALGRVSEDTGGKNYIVHFLRELANQTGEHHFTLFLSSGELAKLGIERSDWLHITEIPNSSATPLHKVIAEQLRLPGYIRRGRIDAMYYPGNFISLFSRVPSVVNIRAVAHCYGRKYGIRGVRRIIRSLLMPPSARKANAIVTPSEDIKRDVVRFMRVPETKIYVIPHGVDLSLFDGEKNRADPEGRNLLNKFGLRSGEYLLYVSALWRYKNQDKLIRAHATLIHKYPELKLVLAGKGTGTDSKYLKEIHSLPQQLGTADHVVFTGALGQLQLRYLYAHAGVFVFPSAYESFGNPIFEAWASGIPLATSNVHSFPEIVQDAGLFFSPEDIAEMTSTIEQLLSDGALCAELIARGRERARKFTWESCVRRTLCLIKGVIFNNG